MPVTTDSLLRRLNIPERLSDIGVGDNRLDESAHKSLSDAATGTDPRAATDDEIESILAARV